MGTWTLTHDGTTQSLAAWGMQSAAISEQSLTAGMFSAMMPGDMLATIPWAYQDQVILKLDGVTKFVGVALTPQRRGAGASEVITVRFADPWWWMGQATYTQPWYIAASSAAYDAPRVALFAGFDPGTGWVRQTIAESIADIITQCNAYFGGNVMQLGTLSGDAFAEKPIPQRAKNATYEAVLRQALAWVPDAVQQWDYSTTPPTLNIVQRAEATARSFAFADGSVMMSQVISRRDDLVVEGINITYAGLTAAGLVAKITDAAGATTGTRIVKTVIDCTGSANGGATSAPTSLPAVEREYTVVSEAVDYTSAEWWLLYGDTGAETASQITVGDGCSMVFAPNAPENAGKTDLGGCDLQWLSGGIPKSRVSANTRIALVTGYLTIETETTEEASAEPILTTKVKERRIVKLLMPVTKLQGDYTQVIAEASQSISGPISAAMDNNFVGVGVAAKLLAVWSVPQFDGELTITKDECDLTARLGDVVNLTGGLEEWETMNATIIGMTRELTTGTTTLQLGVATHLGLDEYVGLIKMSRTRVVPALDLDAQATGNTPSSAPSPNDLDDLVSPGSIKNSTLVGPQTMEITSAVSVFKIEM